MERAELILHLEGGDETVPVQFNPAEYTVSRAVRYGETKTLGESSRPIFTGEERGTLRFQLTLDGFEPAGTVDDSEAEDISGALKKLSLLVTVDAKLHRPPQCSFHWSSFHFRGCVEQMETRHTMFSPDGFPIRAVVELTLKSDGESRIPYESPDRTKRRVLTQDMPLYLLADEAYHDCALWRHIAAANGIKNPRRVPVGAVLRIPPLPKPV